MSLRAYFLGEGQGRGTGGEAEGKEKEREEGGKEKGREKGGKGEGREAEGPAPKYLGLEPTPVSYTHLTLPTIYSV